MIKLAKFISRFIDGLSQKRRQIADALAPPKLSLAQAQALASERALKETKEPEAAVAAASKFAVNSDPSANRPVNQLPKGIKVPPGGTSPVPNKVSLSSSGSNLNQSLSANSKEGIKPNNNHIRTSNGTTPVSTPRRGPRGNGIDDFVPDADDHINAFLSEASNSTSGANIVSKLEDSSDDESSKRGNPLVVSIEEDFDEEILSTTAKIVVPDSIANAKDSSDDEEVLHEMSPRATPTDSAIGRSDSSSTIGAKLGFNLFVTDKSVKNNSPSSLEESDQPSSLDSAEKKSKKSSSHHKKSSSKNKHKKSSKKDNSLHHHMDLEEFLSGDTSELTAQVDSSAYEAL